MSTTTVADVMTTDLVTVAPSDSFKHVVEVLARHSISAVPVVDTDSTLVGVVSEADLLIKEGRPNPSWIPSLLSGSKQWRRWMKARATTAERLMTPGVKHIEPTASLAAAARRLTDEGVRRLFVVEDGKLVGVLARRDALRAFLATDEDLRDTVREGVIRHALWIDPEEITVTVMDGVVTLTGSVERRSEVELAEALTARTPGVVAVRNELEFTTDDSNLDQEMAAAHGRWRRSQEGFSANV